MSEPWYDIVLALHTLATFIGFGALATSGLYAAKVRRSREPSADLTLTRYFRPGHNLAARAIYLVPLAGGILLALGHGQDVGQPYPWIGLALWLVATGIATAVLWPAEQQLQLMLAGGRDGDGALALSAARLERAAALCSVLFVCALAVMVIQPG